MRVARISCPKHTHTYIVVKRKPWRRSSSSEIKISFLGEANQLALDFRTVCESDFPTKVTADYVARHHSDPNEIGSRRNMVLAAK